MRQLAGETEQARVGLDLEELPRKLLSVLSESLSDAIAASAAPRSTSEWKTRRMQRSLSQVLASSCRSAAGEATDRGAGDGALEQLADALDGEVGEVERVGTRTAAPALGLEQDAAPVGEQRANCGRVDLGEPERRAPGPPLVAPAKAARKPGMCPRRAHREGARGPARGSQLRTFRSIRGGLLSLLEARSSPRAKRASSRRGRTPLTVRAPSGRAALRREVVEELPVEVVGTPGQVFASSVRSR